MSGMNRGFFLQAPFCLPRVKDPGGSAGRAPLFCCCCALPALPYLGFLGLHGCFRNVPKFLHVPLYEVF
eukprot:2679784-Amphidinium_carterae.1